MLALGRLTVLAVVTAAATALAGGVAYADSDDESWTGDEGWTGSGGSGGSPGGSWNPGEGYGSDVDRDDERSHGGRGGKAGTNLADCDTGLGPGGRAKQCASSPPRNGADGPAHLLF